MKRSNKVVEISTLQELQSFRNVIDPAKIAALYLFVGLISPVYCLEAGQVTASLYVKYLDERTKAAQISQFELTLEKNNGNWKINNY